MLNWTTAVNEDEIINTEDVFTVSPNPASDHITVNFSIDGYQNITFDIRNNLGTLLKTLLNKNYSTGKYTEDLSINNLAPGIYYCTFQLGNEVIKTRKLLIMK